MSLELDPALRTDLSRYLPITLLNRLPEREALREAIAHLNGLQTAVRSFLPLYIAEDENLIGRDYSALRRGSFLFADVSGFTALSEKLQQHSGAEGTETLTAVINDFFATMLEILAKSDGQLLKFAGDALLAFFPAADDAADLGDAHKAIRTGLRMQRAMRARFQPVQHEQLVAVLGTAHNSSLTMSIGIARGDLFEALVGNQIQRDHLIQGDLPGLAMQAEGVGERDEVIVDDALAAQVAAQFRSHPLDDGFSQIVDDFGDKLDDYEFELLRRRRAKAGALFDLETGSLLESLAALVRRVQVVSRYVAPNVLHELVHSHDFHLSSENRYTVTLFCHVTGFAELLRDWGPGSLAQVTSLLGRFYNIVQRIVTAHGGTLARTDPYKLGTKLLVTFGAPIAHPDDPDRAVTAALKILENAQQFNQRLNEELPLARRREAYVTVRIGITQGETFAGEVGWKQRREFTVMGDDVNLAARLMANAHPDQILISERVKKRVDAAFELEPIPPLVLKGKSKPVQAYIARSTQLLTMPTTLASDLPFIGHDMFMLSLQMSLRQATLRRRRALSLVGDAGIGKTRIARQFAESALAAGFKIAWMTCQSRNDSKTTWKGLIAQLAGIDLRHNTVAERVKLSAALDDLKLGHLEPVFFELVFDIKHSEPPLTPAARPPQEKPSPAALSSAASEATVIGARSVADIFAAVQKMDLSEKKNSGLFGVVRRAATAQAGDISQPATGDTLYKRVEQRISLSEALVQFLRAYCENQPVLCVIDDLHQENEAALDLLRHVLQQVTQAKLILLLTYEPTAAVAVDAQVLNVPDLSRDETMHIAETLLHAGEIAPRLADLLWERTNGRPLFIESLLRTLLENGFISTGENGVAELKADADLETVPENVRELVISRIDRLEDDARLLLRAAAVLEDGLTAAALDTVAGFADVGHTQHLLNELVRVQILAVGADGSCGFRHGMTQRVLYETLSRLERMKLHRAAVGYFRAQPISVTQTLDLAHHLVKCGQLPQAIEAVTGAAEQYEREQAINSAIELYTHALTLFPDEKSLQTRLEQLKTQTVPPVSG